VDKVEEHARKSPIHLDRATLSLPQLDQKLEGTEKQMKREKLSVRVLLLYLPFSDIFCSVLTLSRLFGVYVSISKHMKPFSILLAQTTSQGFIVSSRTQNTMEILHKEQGKHLLCINTNVLKVDLKHLNGS
jgi:hypothetical protein